MPPESRQLPRAAETVLSTGLNSLAHNALAVSAVQLMRTGGNDLLAEVEFAGSFTANPAANSGIVIWFLPTLETNQTLFEDGADGVIVPTKRVSLVLGMRAVTTAQRRIEMAVLPPGDYRVLLQNQTGSAMAASGNTLRIRPIIQHMVTT
jgi:hypothetical protein